MKVVSGLCLFVVALAYTNAQQGLPPAPADGSCEPGKSYKKDCNTCVCGSNGKLGACTLAYCIPPHSKRETRDAHDELPPAPADGSCEPGKSYKQDCNTCRCGENEKLACTLLACAPPRSKRQNQECSEGQTKAEACNTCHCANGLWACTKKFCPQQNRKRRETCVAGETKQEDCNTCKCTDGGWACTRKICPGQNRRRRDVSPSDEALLPPKCTKTLCGSHGRNRRDTEECTVGAFKKEDCNTCNCIQLGDGTKDWACTKLACPPQESRSRRDAEECAVGSTKQQDCNSCNCVQLGDGKTGWTCTKKFCVQRTRRDV